MFKNSQIKNIKKHLKENLSNYVEIFSENVHVWIENRPGYCDKGRFKVNARTLAYDGKGHIDEQDRFPRYYFDYDCLIIELSWFLRAKLQSEIVEVRWRSCHE